MYEYVDIRGINIYQIHDVYELFDRYNIYNNKSNRIEYNFYAYIILRDNYKLNSENKLHHNNLYIMNRFKLNEIKTYEYIIEYIKLIYNNKDNIINFLKGVDTNPHCYNYTNITPNKLKNIKNFINRLNNSTSMPKLQQEMIEINYELLQYYIGFNNGPIATQFKNIRLEFLNPNLQVPLPYKNVPIIYKTPFYCMETTLDSFLTENIHKFLAFNNDAEKYLNKFKLRCLQKI